MTMPDEALRDEWFRAVATLFPHFGRDAVADTALFRLKDAQHIVEHDFREQKILPYGTPVPGAFLADFTPIYPDDHGTNVAVREGNAIAEHVRQCLGIVLSRSSLPQSAYGR
jgi:hypothetical protein